MNNRIALLLTILTTLSLGFSDEGSPTIDELLELGAMSDRLYCEKGVSIPIEYPQNKTEHLSHQLGQLLMQDMILSNTQGFLVEDQFRPTGRLGRGRGFFSGDILHQLGVQLLIDSGKITKGTLIISDTGHDIPLAAQVLKNREMNPKAVFYYPTTIAEDWANRMRLTAQAQDWAMDIHQGNEKYREGEKTTLVLGIEGHRSNRTAGTQVGEPMYEIPLSKFPSRETLIEMGIDNVVYLYERNPESKDVEKLTIPDAKRYIDYLDMPTQYLGADCRRSIY